MIKLTRAQKQVYELMMKGWSNKAIAEQLSISESAIENHVHDILSRRKAKSRYELISRQWRLADVP